MYVAICGPKGKESVSIREDYIPQGSDKKKTRVIKNLGPLRSLIKDDPDYIIRLKAEVKKESQRIKDEGNVIILASTEEINSASDSYRYVTIGHCLARKIWSSLELDSILPESLFTAVLKAICGDVSSFYGMMEHPDQEKELLPEQIIRQIADSISRVMERNLSEAFCIDIGRNVFLFDGNMIPISVSTFDGKSIDSFLNAIRRARKGFIIDSITVMPSRHLSSEEDLALISDEGYGFIAYSAWMSEITGSEYSCKAKMRLSETEIVKTGKTGAPKKYRNISTKTRIFRQEQILMTDIETDEKEAFDLYERRLWLEDEMRKLPSTDTLVIFLCLILIGYMQYKAGKEISLKQAILGASAIIVGTDNPSFLITATNLYIETAKALDAQTLRKTMSVKQINELFATKSN